MWKRNDGSDRINAIQNRFTAYVVQAVSRRRSQYIKRMAHVASMECGIDPVEHGHLWPQEIDVLLELPPLAQIEDQRLLYALTKLTERERYIILAHVLDERNFSELAMELGLGYQGVAAAYHRVCKKVRNAMEKDMK